VLFDDGVALLRGAEGVDAECLDAEAAAEREPLEVACARDGFVVEE